MLIVYGEGGFAESELIQEDRRGLGDKLGWLKTQLPLFYMAVSFNDASFWKLKNILLKQVCAAQEIPTVALSKIYYGQAEDAQLFKIVNGIRLSKTINDKTLPSVNGRYLRTPAEMEQLYDAEDLQASDHIASICQCDDDAGEDDVAGISLPAGRFLETVFNPAVSGRLEEAAAGTA